MLHTRGLEKRLDGDRDYFTLVKGCNVVNLSYRSISYILTPFIYGLLFLYVDCGKKLCGSLDHLFQIYQRAVVGEGTFKFSADDSLHVVEALRYAFKSIRSKCMISEMN